METVVTSELGAADKNQVTGDKHSFNKNKIPACNRLIS
jgi:hypothetical protein